jgi:sugar/nucleoside kinase (ribokinase family)
VDSDGIQHLRGLVAVASGIHLSQRYPVTEAVGRIGTRDAFAAGLIRGLMLAESMQTAVEFAAAAAHLKQSIVATSTW